MSAKQRHKDSSFIKATNISKVFQGRHGSSVTALEKSCMGKAILFQRIAGRGTMNSR